MLELLQTFCSVVAMGSLNKAADVLHLSQPAITRQIQLLEGQLGAVLLIREQQGVRLTPAGEEVLKHAHQALAAVAACHGAAASVTAKAAQTLRVSAGLHVTMYCLQDWLQRYRERWPAIKVEFRPSPHRAAIQRLLQYEVDLALIGHDVAMPGIRQIPLFADPFVLISPCDAGNGPVHLSDLDGTNLLVMEAGSGMRREIDWVLDRYAVNCNLIAFPTSESIKMGVMLGMGAAIVPRSAAAAEAAQGRLVIREFTDWPAQPRQVRAVLRAEGRVPAPVQAFLDLAPEAAQ